MEYVAIEKFGRDHWSLLAYIEAICVDALGELGQIDRNKLRVNIQTHPALVGDIQAKAILAIEIPPYPYKHGTCLKGHTEEEPNVIKEHDDWDCLKDLDNAGLVEVLTHTNGGVRMTDRGIVIAAQVRAHKVRGGQYATFEIEQILERG